MCASCANVAVKHSAALAPRPIEDEARELVGGAWPTPSSSRPGDGAIRSRVTSFARWRAP